MSLKTGVFDPYPIAKLINQNRPTTTRTPLIMDNSQIILPSNRKFGIFFSIIFLLASAYLYFLATSVILAVLACFLALLTLAVTIFKTESLTPFNKLWMKLGLIIGMIVSPIVLGLIYFIIFTPVAVVCKLIGRDELSLKNMNRTSHWKNRVPAGPEPESFRNQF